MADLTDLPFKQLMRVPYIASRPGILAALALGSAFYYFGWQLFLFQTDDAYIAYRYVANAAAGWGLTFNPPPFQPVEGYTSFLWVGLLWLIWEIKGVTPPAASMVLNPLFGYAGLLLCCAFVLRMKRIRHVDAHMGTVLALVLCGVLSNRTYLTWLSSGLETSLFNLLLMWWVFECFAQPGARTSGWITRLSLSAGLAALARPDGLLAMAGTCVILLTLRLGHKDRSALRLRWAWPLLMVPAHLIWRRFTYGDWLPNTYYAKHIGAWPEAGWRYLASFILEYGVWVWLVIAFLWAARTVRRLRNNPPRLLSFFSPGAIAVAMLLVHAGYYTLRVGGDHFEYRVFSHLIPLLYVSAARMAAGMGGAAVVMGTLGVFVVAALPIQWMHWIETRGLNKRDETYFLISPIAHSFPAFVRPIIKEWDTWQGWLIRHAICVRHQEHKVFFH